MIRTIAEKSKSHRVVKLLPSGATKTALADQVWASAVQLHLEKL
jgi:hypothetical protein